MGLTEMSEHNRDPVSYMGTREPVMSSPASVKSHPLHPMLVALPIGLWTFAFVCDVATVMGRGDPWSTVGTYAIAGGIIGALLAAVPGFIDYLSIDEKEMKKIATTHLLLALGAVAVFALNFWMRQRLPQTSLVPLSLSAVGLLILGGVGWLGGEMVYVKGMAVQAVEELAKESARKEKQPARMKRAG